MNNNCLVLLENELVRDLINLTEIDLSYNMITKIDDLFDNNLKFKYLNLKYNRIESINFRSLATLVNLIYLDLGYNQIKDIVIEGINYFICCATSMSLYLEGNFSKEYTSLDHLLKIVSFR